MARSRIQISRSLGQPTQTCAGMPISQGWRSEESIATFATSRRRWAGVISIHEAGMRKRVGAVIAECLQAYPPRRGS